MCTDAPSPQKKNGGERRLWIAVVNRVPVSRNVRESLWLVVMLMPWCKPFLVLWLVNESQSRFPKENHSLWPQLLTPFNLSLPHLYVYLVFFLFSWGEGDLWWRVCCQILTLFQTKKCHFSHLLSDLASKIYSCFQTKQAGSQTWHTCLHREKLCLLF